jgi:hypothetical protein
LRSPIISLSGYQSLSLYGLLSKSPFVTSAGVNPTRTIQALALHVADSIKQRLATLFD